MGLSAHILISEHDGVIQGGVAFLSAKVPFLPWRIFIVSHGPLPSDPDSPSWLPLMEELDRFCRQHGGICTTLYPHEPADRSVLLSRLEGLGFTTEAVLTSHRFSSTPVTIALHGKQEAEILMSCRPRTRQYIRKALTGDLQLRTHVDDATFDAIYALLSEHGQFRGYHPRPYASLKAAWEWLGPRNQARFFQAWLNDTLVGAIFVIFTGHNSYSITGAVRRNHSELRPAEFLHWHAIREALGRHMMAYDFTSMGDQGGVQFKTGFRPLCGSWQRPRMKIYRPMLAHLIRWAEAYCRPALRGLARVRASRKRSAFMSKAGEKIAGGQAV
jgi:hypothetical protein